MNMLELAFYLSALGYFLGIVIRALPLPFVSLKKLGSALVSDSVFSMVLIFSFRLISYSIEYFGSILGADWELYNSYMMDRIGILTMYFAMLKSITAFLGSTPLGGYVNGLISPLTSMVTASLVSTITLLVTGSVVRTLADRLIALGILLHSIPFKLTRPVGATLIATAIVFSIGLPLMPYFVTQIAGAAVATGLNVGKVCGALFIVEDMAGQKTPYIIIEGYDEQGFLEYRYITNKTGERQVSRIFEGVPCNKHRVEVRVADVSYTFTVEETYYTNGVLEVLVHLPNYLSLNDLQGSVIRGNYDLLGVNRGQGNVKVEINARSKVEIVVYWVGDTGVELYVDGEKIDLSQSESVEYLGVSLRRARAEIGPSRHLLEFRYAENPLNISVANVEVSYAVTLIHRGEASSIILVGAVVLLFLEAVILPWIYVVMLLGATATLARLLGGAYPRVTRAIIGVG